MRADVPRWFVRGTALAFGVALAAGIIYVLLAASGVVVLVFVALLLASGLEPLVDRVRTRTPLARGATLLFVYAGIFVIIAALVLLILPSAINQFNELGPRLQPLLDDAREWAATLQPEAVSQGLIALIDTLQEAVVPTDPQAPNPDQLIELGLTFAEAVISVVAVLTMIYFWLTERARLQRFVLALVPADRRAGARDAWNQMEGRLGSWVRGQLIIMGSVGIATTIAYFLIGLEGALLLGLLAALFEVIPLVGPALGAVPALIVAAITGDVQTVLLVALVYFVIQLVEGNFLIPVVMHNTIGVPPFLVFVSILVGAAVAGIPGALLSVPLVAAVLVVLERMQARESTVPISPEKPPPEELQELADLIEDKPTPASS